WRSFRVQKTTEWPAMDSYFYAHTAPIWIGRVCSSDPAAAREAARDLLRALAVSETRINAQYGGAAAPSSVSIFERPARRSRREQSRVEVEGRGYPRTESRSTHSNA